MLTPEEALDRADPHQRDAVRSATRFARTLAGPVGFLPRRSATGTAFEAIALNLVRTCATVDEQGELLLEPKPRPAPPIPFGPDPVERSAHRDFTLRDAERALALAARPRRGTR